MPLLLLGALVGGGTVWYASDAGKNLVNIALVAGAGYLVFKYMK